MAERCARARHRSDARPLFLFRNAHAEPAFEEHRPMISGRSWGGAAYRTRTCDPRITNAMLYQLS